MALKKLITENLLEDSKSDELRAQNKIVNPVFETFLEDFGVFCFVDIEWMQYYRFLRKAGGYILHSGKRELVYNLLEKVYSVLFWKYRVHNPEKAVLECLDLVSIYFRSRPRRSSGKVYQVPEVFLKSVARRKGLKLVVLEARKRMRASGNFVRNFCDVIVEIRSKKGPCIDHVRRLEKWALDNAIYMKTLGRRGKRRRRTKL